MDPIDGDPGPADATPPEAHRRRPRAPRPGSGSCRGAAWSTRSGRSRSCRRPGRDDPRRLAADPLRDRRRDPRRPGARRLRGGAGAMVDRRDATGPARPRPGRGADRDRAARVHAPRPQPGARPRLRRPEPRVRRGRRSGLRHATSIAAGGAGNFADFVDYVRRHRGARRHPPGGRRPARAERPAGRRPATSTCTGPSRRRSTRPGSAWASARDRRRRRARGRLDRPRRRPRRRSSREPTLMTDHQHELAAPPRRPDGRRPDRDGDSTASRSWPRRSRWPAR